MSLRSGRAILSRSCRLCRTRDAGLVFKKAQSPIGTTTRCLSTTSSPIATSSNVTLDDFPLFSSTDPIILSLSYATDQELISTILNNRAPSDDLHFPSHTASLAQSSSSTALRPVRPHVSPYDLDWTSSIDPAFAFLALRTRETFTRFTEHIRPRLKSVYDALRSSGMHQLLASDLLLIHRDARVLRDLLELNAAEGMGGRPLRHSVVASMYRRLDPELERGHVEGLSVKAMSTIVKALIWEGNSALLSTAFMRLHAAAGEKGVKNLPWEVFSIILHFIRQGQLDVAGTLLQRLDLDGRLAGMAHAEDLDHLDISRIQSVCLRAALAQRQYSQAQIIASELLDTAQQTSLTNEIADILYETCRVAIVSQNPGDLTWAGDTLLRLVNLPNAPPLSSSTLDTYLEAVRPKEGLGFYLSLPEDHHPPSPRNIMRLASVRLQWHVVLPLLKDINQIPSDEFIAQRGAFLKCLVDAKKREVVMQLYDGWEGSFTLSGELMVSIVRLFKSRRKAKYPAFLNKVIDDFKALMPDTPSIGNTLALAQAYMRLDRPELVHQYLQTMDTSEAAFVEYLDDLAANQPVAAYDLISHGIQAGLPLSPPINIIASACLAGRWDCLDQVKRLGLGDDDRREIVILKAIRKGRVRSAWRFLDMLRQKGRDLPFQVHQALISRCLGLGRWSLAWKIWLKMGPDDYNSEKFSSGQNMLKRLVQATSFPVIEESVIDLVESDEFERFGEIMAAHAKKMDQETSSLLDHDDERQVQRLQQTLDEIKRLIRADQEGEENNL